MNRVTTVVPNSGTPLHSEAFGTPGDPPLLLIMGQMASMLWWPEGLCERLAAGGRYVIRYDQRDTGLSGGDEPGHPSYSAADLVADAAAVLDGHGIDRAHVVGMSMGGIVAQMLALTGPDRVATLTVISTTSITRPPVHELPDPTPAYLEQAQQGGETDWSDTGQIRDAILADCAALAGTRHPHDAEAARALVTADLERAVRPASLINHTLLGDGNDDGPPPKLTSLTVPALVVHGDADPLFPIEHGEALAAEMPGARLERIAGGGHELHPGDWNQIAGAILAHSAA
ncbi:alpha/beta hydrolase [Paraconexibacter sp. AEG42_29]|uniref:alpha/beta fold hydrolase n=1 Tax=Paraconexibacter sp. AEG42_29 TaxID=2997339 RepID=UPI00339D8CF4